MIHAIILTLNEERHIERCIRSLAGFCASVTVIDSGSTDATVEIAQRMGASVHFNKFVNHSEQINFGIRTVSDRGGWILRIDADELIESESAEWVETVSSFENFVDGILVQRRIHFLGRRIRYGGIEPSWQLRLWRNGCGHCELRWMDEHMVVRGKVKKSNLVLSDINLNSLSWWINKHDGYASREAIEILNLKYSFVQRACLSGEHASKQAVWRRFIKDKIYARMPHGVRSLCYFFYRFVVRLGFLDGRSGFYFHLMQGLWYRSLVDAKVFEIEAYMRIHKVTVAVAIFHCTGLSISPNNVDACDLGTTTML